jgi:hypothetical protein
MRLFTRLLPPPEPIDSVTEQQWTVPAWLLEACGAVLTLLIVDLWLFCLAGRPQCEHGGCSGYESVLAWSLLGLASTLLVLGFMGLVPAVLGLREARRVRRVRRAIDRRPDFA